MGSVSITPSERCALRLSGLVAVGSSEIVRVSELLVLTGEVLRSCSGAPEVTIPASVPCVANRYAIRRKGMCLSQSFWLWSANFDSCASKVRIKCYCPIDGSM